MYHWIRRNIRCVNTGDLALKHDIAATRMIVAGLQIRALFCRYSFDPNQPRVPRGNSDGGEWTDGGGFGAADRSPASRPQRVAQNTTGNFSRASLAQHESRGGHTIARHVGKSPDFLMRQIKKSRVRGLFFSGGMHRAGSFPSITAAEKLINATLSRNMAVVKQVAAGARTHAFIKSVFRTKTGVEAFDASRTGRPVLRDTYGVGVKIVHDPASPSGYIIITAYPRND